MSGYAGTTSSKVVSPTNGSSSNPTMTYDEDQVVTSPLCELSLGTIVEAKEGSTSGESETGSFSEPQEEPPPTPPDDHPTTLLKRDATLDLSEYQDLVVSKKNTHPDVDGGWAWVVFLSIFLVFVITAGLLFTTGLYYVQMLNEYGQSRSYTAWMGSLVNAFFMLGGPISSSFIQRWGCRAALMGGSVLMTIGYVCSAFSNSLEMLFFTYGVVVAPRPRVWMETACR